MRVISCTVLSVLFVFVMQHETLGQQRDPDRLFTDWDRNGDDKLTRDELPDSARRNFARVDTDRNGSISLKEHRTFLSRRRVDAGNRRKISEKIRHFSDLAYADTENPRQTLDLLVPKNADDGKQLPVVVFIHGGGWRKGHKNGGLNRIMRFAESGNFAAATVGYRLSDEAKWPAQIHDCKSAIRWLKGNAAKYHLDPNRICVFGTSAGGHLAAMLGVTGGVASLEGSLGGHRKQSSRVAAVIDFFGPTNFLTMNDFPGKLDHDASDSPESLLIGGAIQKHRKKAETAAPVTWVSDDDAPVLIMHGTADPLVPFDQSVKFHRKLAEAGVFSVLVPILEGEHGFGGAEVDARVDAFLERFLLNRDDVEISSEAIRL